MRTFLVPVFALLALAAGSVHAAGDAAAGKTKSAACAGCHGADGNSTTAQFPRLAGQHAGYLVKQLHDFKSGARSNPTMSGMAAPLSDQDILDLAAYFSSQKPAPGAAEPKYVDRGKKIFRGGIAAKGVPACMACHEPDGSGNPQAKFPALSGQHPEYTASTLKAFRSGQRSNDPNEMMTRAAANLSDADITALAQYVSGLH